MQEAGIAEQGAVTVAKETEREPDPKVLTFKQSVLPGKLYEELVAVPGLAPKVGEFGKEAVFGISYKDGEVSLKVPADADEQAITAVLKQHDPTPPEPAKSRQEKAREALAGIDETKPGPAIKKIKAALDELLAD